MSTYFGRPDVLAEGVNADIDTDEETIVETTVMGATPDSQITIFFDYTLGTHTSIKIRYYYRNEEGGDWYQIPLKTLATGVMSDTPTVINSTTPAARFIEDLPFSAGFAFKITGQGVGGANASVTAKILSRNN